MCVLGGYCGVQSSGAATLNLERANVEVAMWEKGIGWILRELASDRQAKSRSADVMDGGENPKFLSFAPTNFPCSWPHLRHIAMAPDMMKSRGVENATRKGQRLPNADISREVDGPIDLLIIDSRI